MNIKDHADENVSDFLPMAFLFGRKVIDVGELISLHGIRNECSLDNKQHEVLKSCQQITKSQLLVLSRGFKMGHDVNVDITTRS